MFESQNHLYNTGNTRGSFRVTKVGFYLLSQRLSKFYGLDTHTEPI